eukprot:CAMPEP_0202693356 /NCGR_PEP_ID=MMETSP1385-20130828/7502_1 /ASSEMBLY_ACC=CAM_ASM_000861 /TAXON_ID=933848 /ORGANISM="Elphidium margaritaceum" /LENGTH=155 /DNA_ID=CAMNT_0049349027 /DNA_START=23 /DNA_END=490 /DNA_ORIENTATION=+
MTSVQLEVCKGDTRFYARLMGAYMVPLGVGLIVSNKYYYRMFQKLSSGDDDADPVPAVISWSFLSTGLGVAIITNHNRWDTFPEKLISLCGWAALGKGVLLGVVPKKFLSRGAIITQDNLKYLGLFSIVFGGYLLKMGISKCDSNCRLFHSNKEK